MKHMHVMNHCYHHFDNVPLCVRINSVDMGFGQRWSPPTICRDKWFLIIVILWTCGVS